jgi:hypothetical protein
MLTFDLKKLDDANVREHDQVNISNRFAALENLDNELDINRSLKDIIGYRNFNQNSLSRYKLKQHKSCVHVNGVAPNRLLHRGLDLFLIPVHLIC